MKRRRVPARLVFRFPVAEQLCADHDKHDHTVPAVSRCPADDRVVVQSVWIRTPPRHRGRQGRHCSRTADTRAGIGKIDDRHGIATGRRQQRLKLMPGLRWIVVSRDAVERGVDSGPQSPQRGILVKERV